MTVDQVWDIITGTWMKSIRISYQLCLIPQRWPLALQYFFLHTSLHVQLLVM